MWPWVFGRGAFLVGQAFGQLLPRRTTIDRLVNAAVRAAAVESVGREATLIGRRVKGVRTLRVHDNIADARVVVYLQNLRPTLAAVNCLLTTPLRIRSPQMAHRRHVPHVRIARI